MRNLQLALFLSLCALSLTACAAPRQPEVVTQIKVEKVKPPIELLTCLDEPVSPPPEYLTVGRWDRAVAVYILMWAQAHADCKARIEALKAWNDAQ